MNPETKSARHRAAQVRLLRGGRGGGFVLTACGPVACVRCPRIG